MNISFNKTENIKKNYNKNSYNNQLDYMHFLFLLIIISPIIVIIANFLVDCFQNILLCFNSIFKNLKKRKNRNIFKIEMGSLEHKIKDNINK